MNKKTSLEKKDTLFCFFAASLLPVLFTIYWVIQNTQLPGSDAASYLLGANQLHHQFSDRGFWHGLSSAYHHRGWRPVFFPLLVVPFIFIAKGNLLYATGLTAIVSIFVSSIYVYLYSRFMLARLPAIITTSIICSLPLILDQAVGFFAECFFFPSIIGALYHLIKSEYFSKFNHAVAFAFLVSLAALLRPVEMLIHLILVFTIFLYMGVRHKKFTKQNIVILIGLSLGSLLIIFACAKYFPNNSVYDNNILENIIYFINNVLTATFVFFIGWCVYIGFSHVISIKHRRTFVSHKKNNDFILLCIVSFIFTIVLAWYLPFAFQTVGWIYRTSLGDIAAGTTRMISSSLLDEVKMQVMGEGNFIIYTSLFLFFISLCKQPSLLKKEISLIMPAIFLLLVSLLPILEVLFTVQDIIRKLSTAFPAFLMGMLMVGLMKGPWQKARNIFALIVLIIQFIGLSAVVFYPDGMNQKIKSLFGIINPPIFIQPNPHETVLNFLQEQSKKLGINYIGIEVHPNIAEPVEPFLLSIMIEFLNTSLKGDSPYLYSYSSQSLLYLHTRYPAIFLSDKVVDMNTSSDAVRKYTQLYQNEKNPSIKAFYELLMLFSQKKLGVNGWKVGPCIILKSITQIEYRGCLLIAK